MNAIIFANFNQVRVLFAVVRLPLSTFVFELHNRTSVTLVEVTDLM
jgi:hypothetical protein